MYSPPHHAETDIARIHAAIAAIGFGHLVTAGAAGLFATPLPLLLAPDGQSLIGHIAKANPHWRAGTTPGLAIFQGPHTYVSPGFYHTKRETGRVVPTWNYVVVQARGMVTFTEDEGFVRDAITRLTDRYEALKPARRGAAWKVTDAPAEFIAAQIRGIVGVRLAIETLEGKWKMSQNRNAADRAGVIAGLTERGESEIAGLIPPP